MYMTFDDVNYQSYKELLKIKNERKIKKYK